jgi:tRNA A37 threonylcarbamoyltransferase TsaD
MSNHHLWGAAVLGSKHGQMHSGQHVYGCHLSAFECSIANMYSLGAAGGVGHLAMFSTDKDNTAAAATMPSTLDGSLVDAAASLSGLPNPVGDQISNMIASGSDLWTTVPLMSLNLPALDATTSVTPMGMCAVFAMLAICANHKTNHLYAPAGTNTAASVRKSIMGFWNEQVRNAAALATFCAH